MRICQKLYEEGLITYMRTDSKTFSKNFLESVKNYIVSKWDESYVNPKIDVLGIRKTSKKKHENAQDAHEAIRPTDISVVSISNKFKPREKKMYDLIWRVSCAACMRMQF